MKNIYLILVCLIVHIGYSQTIFDGNLNTIGQDTICLGSTAILEAGYTDIVYSIDSNEITTATRHVLYSRSKFTLLSNNDKQSKHPNCIH